MASVVDLCNRALQRLGVKQISSIDEDSVNARACRACYESLRDAEYRAHTWSFATKRAQLAADATAPLFGKANAFNLPVDFVRLLDPDPARLTGCEDFQIEGRQVLTNWSAPLEVRYVWRVVDANTMDALFREALSAKMAWEMAEALTQSNKKKESAKDDYKYAILEARRANAIERPAQISPPDSWLTARA